MIPSKLPNIGTSIFSVMSKLANEHNAINLSQGFPDFQSSAELINLVDQYMRKGYNQYAPMPGVPELRAQIAEKTKYLYNADYDPEDEITVTSGATQALFTAISAVVQEDDEVIVFEPAYDSYVPAIRLNGGRPVFISLRHPDYRIDWSEVKKMINARTRMIIINSPHNPSGMVMTDEDIQSLSKIVSGSKIVVLSDEVYEHIVFDEQKHVSVAGQAALKKQSIIVSSFGKTYHNTGWKLGYALADSAIMREFRKIHQFQVYAVNTPIQHALAEYMKKREPYLELSAFYQQKRDFFADLLSATPFELTPAAGTYFQSVSYQNISDMKEMEFALYLTQEVGVAAIPFSEFYHDKTDNKVVRLCFAKSNKTLEAAAEKLRNIKV